MASLYNQMCRTCLAEDADMCCIFDASSSCDNMSYSQLICATTGVQITESDGLPRQICSMCKQSAVISYQFRQQSCKADVTLRSLLQQHNNQPTFEVKKEKPDIKFECDDIGGDFGDFEIGGSAELYCEIDVENKTNIKKNPVCLICKSTFECEDLLSSHMVDCVKGECLELKEMCPLCGVHAPDETALLQHIVTHHSSKPARAKRNTKQPSKKRAVCELCKTKVASADEMHSHLATHGGGRVLVCSLCQHMYVELEHLKSHLVTHDGVKMRSDEEAARCSRSLPTAEGVAACGEAAVACGKCGRLLAAADKRAHRATDHPRVACGKCSRTFVSGALAVRHRAACPRRAHNHECRTCGMRFAYELTLNKHILKEHKGQPVSVDFVKMKTGHIYRCKHCTSCFLREDLLNKHLLKHSGNAKYECDVCKKRFNRKDNLRAHVVTHDAARARPAGNLCLYCGRGFSNSSNLIVHMRRHTGEKPYKCDLCAKGFPRSSDLQCHRRSHTGERPYLCNICGKGFRRNNKLSRHMRVHTGARPYKCQYCEKAFSQSNDLTLHVRRHTGDKPYVCELCGDRFIQGTALQQHRRSHSHYPPSTSAPTEHKPTLPASNT